MFSRTKTGAPTFARSSGDDRVRPTLWAQAQGQAVWTGMVVVPSVRAWSLDQALALQSCPPPRKRARGRVYSLTRPVPIRVPTCSCSTRVRTVGCGQYALLTARCWRVAQECASWQSAEICAWNPTEPVSAVGNTDCCISPFEDRGGYQAAILSHERSHHATTRAAPRLPRRGGRVRTRLTAGRVCAAECKPHREASRALRSKSQPMGTRWAMV